MAMTIRCFEEIEAWQLARKLARRIWEISSRKNFVRDVKLHSQINDAAGSTMDNIAEGFGRGGTREFINFLSISRASNDDVRSQVCRAFDRKYISEEELNELVNLSRQTGVKINNFIDYLKRVNHRGSKYK